MKYNLPRGYLSYSAIMLWIKNPDAYRRRYYENEPPHDSIPMTFGKTIADVLESRDYTEFPALAQVPFYPVSEHPIMTDIGGVPIKAYLDLWEPETFTFGEVKTGGSTAWDAVKVAKHEQLPFYSLLIKEVYGQVNPKVNLIWLETRYVRVMEKVGKLMLECDGRDLELTGKMEVFERRIAEWERKRMKKLIIQSAKEISTDYDAFLKTTPQKDSPSGGSGDLQGPRAGVHERTPKEGSQKANI